MPYCRSRMNAHHSDFILIAKTKHEIAQIHTHAYAHTTKRIDSCVRPAHKACSMSMHACNATYSASCVSVCCICGGWWDIVRAVCECKRTHTHNQIHPNICIETGCRCYRPRMCCALHGLLGFLAITAGNHRTHTRTRLRTPMLCADADRTTLIHTTWSQFTCTYNHITI